MGERLHKVFGPDRIRTLVSMDQIAPIGGNLVTILAPSFFIGSSFLQVTRTIIKSRMISKFSKIQPGTAELFALECLEKSPWAYNGRNVVSTLVPSFLDGFLSFLQVTRITIKT